MILCFAYMIFFNQSAKHYFTPSFNHIHTTIIFQNGSYHPSIFACIMRRKTVMNDIYNPSEDERSNLVNNEIEMRHLSNASDAHQKTKKS